MDADQQARIGALFQRAFKLGHDDYQGKFDLYSQALGIYPDHAPSYFNRAMARGGLKDYSGAIEDFDKVLSLNPSSRYAFSGRARARLSLGDLPGAMADFERELRAVPDDPLALLQRADANLRSGDLKGAVADCSIVLTKVTYVECFETRAWAQLVLGNAPAAYDDAFQALALGQDPRQALLYQQRSRYWVLIGYLAQLGLGKRAEAGAWLQEWKKLLADEVWPGRMLELFRGEITRDRLEASVRDEKERLEAQAFIALEAQIRGDLRGAEAIYSWIAENAEGYSLARAIAEHRAKSSPPIR